MVIMGSSQEFDTKVMTLVLEQVKTTALELVRTRVKTMVQE